MNWVYVGGPQLCVSTVAPHFAEEDPLKGD